MYNILHYVYLPINTSAEICTISVQIWYIVGIYIYLFTYICGYLLPFYNFNRIDTVIAFISWNTNSRLIFAMQFMRGVHNPLVFHDERADKRDCTEFAYKGPYFPWTCISNRFNIAIATEIVLFGWHASCIDIRKIIYEHLLRIPMCC